MHSTNRGGRGQSTTRGRGRGRGRGGGFDNRDVYGDRPTLHPVPTIQQVFPGGPVSIVLKEDQPTGHEVQGIVAELLTKGNHPRGIKVRLQDGRVGRVQRMASMQAATSSSAGMTELGRDGEPAVISESNQGIQTLRNPAAIARPGKYSDFRTDGGEAPPAPELSLTDYIVIKTKGKKGKKKAQSNMPSEENGGQEPGDSVSEAPATSTCPVCGNFEGDEVAVAHHVNTHFD